MKCFLCVCIWDRIKFCSLLIQEDLSQLWFSKKFWNNFAVGIALENPDIFKTEPLTHLIKRFYDMIALAKDIAAQEHKTGRELWFSFQFVLFFIFFVLLTRTCFLVFPCCSISGCFITVAQLKFVLEPKFSDYSQSLPAFTVGQLSGEWAGSSGRGTHIHPWGSDTFEFCLCRQYGCKPLELWAC